jgi:hypothetical protein
MYCIRLIINMFNVMLHKNRKSFLQNKDNHLIINMK